MNPTFRDNYSINKIALGYRGKFVTLLCLSLLFTGIMGEKIISVDFEVFGEVQGVFFRKNTVLKGKELGLKGWCMNTHKGTVQGHMEGPLKEIDEMKHWLRYTGSKMSKIDKAEFTNEKDIEKFTLSGFSVRH